jgi:hypothetical protein
MQTHSELHPELPVRQTKQTINHASKSEPDDKLALCSRSLKCMHPSTCFGMQMLMHSTVQVAVQILLDADADSDPKKEIAHRHNSDLSFDLISCEMCRVILVKDLPADHG